MAYTVRIANQHQSFIVNDDETILDAALRQNFDIEHSCCEGICGSCEAQIIDGNVSYHNTEHLVLDEEERNAGRALLCSAYAKSDLLIDAPSSHFPLNPHLPEYHYQLLQIDAIGFDIHRALFAPQAKTLHYIAGQYIEVILPGFEDKPFSIANAPNAQGMLEIHIRCQKDNDYAKTLLAFIKTSKALHFRGPKGHCFYHPNPHLPMILLAVGTGFAPIKAILEQAFSQGLIHETRLFWAGKTPHDLYQLDLVNSWSAKYTNFSCVPILAKAEGNENWPGVYGNLIDIVLDYYPTLNDHHIYLGGPMQLSMDALEYFTAKGAKTQYMYSDMFDLI